MLDESSFSFFDSLMVFMTHYLSIESPNGIIFELEKKSSGRLSKNENLSGRVPWNRKKREQNEKKKSLTPFGYLANVQNYLFLLPRETNLIFNIGK